MADWGNDFDDQCRTEGLEVPTKSEEQKKQPSSETKMEQNEENKGFASSGIGRGGAFGGGKTMNAPPPQTSFGATSGIRMGGSFGSSQCTADARGSPLGSSDDGGGNICSVGIHRDKPACAFTRGGGFGTNHGMSSFAPTTIKNNHEGGRFGALAPRSFGESSEEKKTTVGGRFGSGFSGVSSSSEDHGISAASESIGSLNDANSTMSRASVGGAFGAKSSTSDGGSFGSSRTVGGSFGSAKPLTTGGTFGAKAMSPDPNSSNSIGIGESLCANADNSSTCKVGNIGSSISFTNSTASVGGAFGSKYQTTEPPAVSPSETPEVKPSTLGGAFGSRSSTGGAFGTGRTSSVGGAFGKKPEFSSTQDYSSPPPATNPQINGSNFSSRSTVTQSNHTVGGGFGVKAGNTPLQERKTSTDNAISFNLGAEIQERKVYGGFGSKSDSFSVPGINADPKATFGGGFSSTSAGPFGGSFGNSELAKPAFGGGFASKSLNQSEEKLAERLPTSSSTGSFGGAHGTNGAGSLGRESRFKPEVPTVHADTSPNFKCGGGFSTSTSSGNFGPSFRESEINTGFGQGFVSKENSNPFSNDTTHPRGGFGITENKQPFGTTGSNEISASSYVFDEVVESREHDNRNHLARPGFQQRGRRGFGVSRSTTDFDKDETIQAPFMSGQQPPMRGAFRGGFRGGRGAAGGHMDLGAGQGHGMGRGQGQMNQPFVPQQRSTPPQYQNVVPDAKYKYTKPAEESHEKVPVPADIALLNKYIQKEVKMMKDMVVDVQRQDPKSPLYSISSFRELRLKPEVLQALDQLNFQFPTRIQETALPLLLMEPPSNLIAQAQSGTGKTAAFVLTMLCRIDVNLKCPQCICLAPTLELAKQIGEVVEKMGRYMENLKIHYAIKGGNMAAMRGRKLTEQIVIGTPGITRDYLQKYQCIDPAMIRCLVLDEADVMIYHQGFTDISTTIYNMVEEASDSVQSMLFSATYDEPVITFATKIIKNAIVVMLKREEQALPNIKQFYVQCACRDSKYAAIVNLYSGLAVASSVIFCHTKASVMWLFENMKARGHQVDVLHGDMNVVERADTIIRFKRGDFKVLVTTNVFARGIDVAQVSVVINYDLPVKYTENDTPLVIDGFTQPDCETYLHRIGRTGRFGKTGIAINFIDSEDSMNMINVLENHFQMKITRMDPSNLVELEAIEMS